EETPYYQSLVEGFRNLGYVDGQNITLEHRFPNEVPDVFGRMAAELVSLNCDVLVGAGAAAPHLKKGTKTIPIVFMFGFDPSERASSKTLHVPVGMLRDYRTFPFN